MNRTYRSTIELKNSVLSYDDIVIFSFRQGPSISYQVKDQGLMPLEKGNAITKIFSVLDLSPKMTASEAYGYQCLDAVSVKSQGYGYSSGSWPSSNYHDYRALTRLVFTLFSHAENDFIRGEGFTMSHNEKRRLEMTGAKLPPRPQLYISQAKNTSGIVIQTTMINFEGRKYSIEEWEALKTLHQVSRIPKFDVIPSAKINTSLNINNKQEHESIIVRSTSATISSGKRSGGTSVSCRRNPATISVRENSDQTRPVQSTKRLKHGQRDLSSKY